MNMTASSGRQGIALIMSLAILAVVGALVLGSVLTTQLELAVSRNDIAATQAQYLAQAGLQTTKARLFQAYRFVTSEEGGTDACASVIDTMIDFNRDGTGFAWNNNAMSLGSTPVFSATDELVGFYTVDLLRDPVRLNVITIRSEGRRTLDPSDVADPLATSRAFGTFSISTGSGVEQAIYAGSGSGMGLINGNAQVYGGIYIEGDRAAFEADGSQPVVFDASGTFRQFNGYDSTVLRSGNYNPTDFLSVTDVDNLCASLRVGFGSVAVGSSVELGKPDNKLYSVAVGQNGANVTYNGTAIEGDVDNTCKKNRGVCSQEGVSGFNLIDVPPFPRLDEPPANAELCNSAATWRACIQNEAQADGVVIEFDSSGFLVDVGLTEPCVGVLQTARAATDRTLTLGTTDLTCTDSSGNGFAYTYAAGRGSFVALGSVNIRGLDLVFDEPTSYTIGGTRSNAGLSLESDSGTIGMGGDLRIESDFVPASGSKYPDVVLALVAEHTVTLNGGNNTTVAAPIYAGDLFRMRANSTLVGQVIADSFCSMGNAGSDDYTCNTAGAPPTIIFAAAGTNRPAFYQAVAVPGGTPTFTQLGYEQR